MSIIIHNYFLLLQNFSRQCHLVVVLWSLSDNKSPRVSWTLLSILADLNNAVIWMVSILPLIFNSSSLVSKPLETVPSAQITIGITVTFMFHNVLSSLTKSQYLFIFSLYLISTLWSAGDAKSTILQVLFAVVVVAVVVN